MGVSFKKFIYEVFDSLRLKIFSNILNDILYLFQSIISSKFCILKSIFHMGKFNVYVRVCYILNFYYVVQFTINYHYIKSSRVKNTDNIILIKALSKSS